MDTSNNIMEGNPVAVAFEKAQVAQDVYNNYVNYVLNNGDDINWPELERLAKIANDADRELLDARDRALNCTCTPDSVNACDVCVGDNRERYGDSIPFMESE
jgi:hypothetical protein